MTKHTLSLIVAALVVISVLFLNCPTQAKQPFAWEDNLGLPGCLARVDQLNEMILELKQQIVQKDKEIADQHQQILGLLDLHLWSNSQQIQALLSQTGQTNCYASDGFEMYEIPCEGTGQDGENQSGVPWPAPRFTDNLNGTVTDNLTGLIWTNKVESSKKGWENALGFCNGLADGSYDLSDESEAGDWRLPNVKELQSLADYRNIYPALPDTEGTGQLSEGNAFYNVRSGSYWTSTTSAYATSSAWFVNFVDGHVYYGRKSALNYVWCVRGE